ncbi:MAG: carboxypeptidase-like regulatory domain-containing protein, partial [Algoriphagus sp.]|nr:carboxypeptidase-like regulatory domain-containing protein [Algoriphagus sp.]
MRKFLSIAFALVVLCTASVTAQDQRRVLRGKVTASTDRLPMPGVTILDKSNQSGTTTNVDGEYSISVTDKSVLVFSFIGFVSK